MKEPNYKSASPDARNIKPGMRLYHIIFGWVKVTHPPIHGKTLVAIEADEVEYYVVGKGRVTYKRQDDGTHTVYTPISDLVESDKVQLSTEQHLRKMGYGCTLTFWDKDKTN